MNAILCRGYYHGLYVKTDDALLGDVFENFRNLFQDQYSLDPAHYHTSPGLSWDTLLEKTGVELELFTDLEMNLFVERGMRGGTSMVSKRYAKANNPLMPDFYPSKPKKYIMYQDANNLPNGDFQWKSVMQTENEILKKIENTRNGWILEVDLEYPEELHEEHNSYPLAPEKRTVEKNGCRNTKRKQFDDSLWTPRSFC